MLSFVPFIFLIILFAACASAVVAWRIRRAQLQASLKAHHESHDAVMRAAAEQVLAAARGEAEGIRRRAEVEALTGEQQAREQAEKEFEEIAGQLDLRVVELEGQLAGMAQRAQDSEVRATALTKREQEISERENAWRARREEARGMEGEFKREIERVAGETADEVRLRLMAEWLEAARSGAAEQLRRIEASAGDPEYIRQGKRMMGISIQRYHGHYLTERLLTNVPIAAGFMARIAGPGEENLRAIEEVSHVKLVISDEGDMIHLDGQDSFGREIARRAIDRLGRNEIQGADEVRRICLVIAEELEREVVELGRRAFKELAIPRANPELVKLVGKLNYRASYTQNQWKHAVEAAFLAGMMACELGLDVKLARRAALLHDIGKALSHEIDGSHSLIGADLARRHGESELVVNAIAAHHGDVPFDSPYALLVAGADALSGGRPGARRQQDDNYVERIADLERIASSYPGVEQVYAVQGGREVRVHVAEGRISEKRAGELSSEIASRISQELTFPGQIKVTVIREMRAVEIAS